MPEWITIDENGATHVTLVPETAYFNSIVTSGVADLRFTKTQGWEDLRVPLNAVKLGGSKDPTFSKVNDDGLGSQGVFAYVFSNSQEQEVYFQVQIPHSWKLEDVLYPHVHWSPADSTTGTVRWGLEYSWANLNAVYSATTIITGDEVVSADSTKKHLLTEIGSGIDGSAISGVSSMLDCRLFRDVSVSGNLAAGVALKEFDFHYEIDTVGSYSQYVKYPT